MSVSIPNYDIPLFSFCIGCWEGDVESVSTNLSVLITHFRVTGDVEWNLLSQGQAVNVVFLPPVRLLQ